jgi:hypothetical protein
MGKGTRKIRKTFYVEPRMIKRAKRLLGLRTEAEVVQRSVECIVEMEEFWQFMDKTRGAAKGGSFHQA